MSYILSLSEAMVDDISIAQQRLSCNNNTLSYNANESDIYDNEKDPFHSVEGNHTRIGSDPDTAAAKTLAVLGIDNAGDDCGDCDGDDDDVMIGEEGGGNEAIEKGKTTDNRWTEEEGNLFFDAFYAHGRDYDKLATIVKTRNAEQVRRFTIRIVKRVRKFTNSPAITDPMGEVRAVLVYWRVRKFLNLRQPNPSDKMDDRPNRKFQRILTEIMANGSAQARKEGRTFRVKQPQLTGFDAQGRKSKEKVRPATKVSSATCTSGVSVDEGHCNDGIVIGGPLGESEGDPEALDSPPPPLIPSNTIAVDAIGARAPDVTSHQKETSSVPPALIEYDENWLRQLNWVQITSIKKLFFSEGIINSQTPDGYVLVRSEELDRLRESVMRPPSWTLPVQFSQQNQSPRQQHYVMNGMSQQPTRQENTVQSINNQHTAHFEMDKNSNRMASPDQIQLQSEIGEPKKSCSSDMDVDQKIFDGSSAASTFTATNPISLFNPVTPSPATPTPTPSSDAVVIDLSSPPPSSPSTKKTCSLFTTRDDDDEDPLKSPVLGATAGLDSPPPFQTMKSRNTSVPLTPSLTHTSPVVSTSNAAGGSSGSRVMLYFFPRSAHVRSAVMETGLRPNVRISASMTKTFNSIKGHLCSKWGLAHECFHFFINDSLIQDKVVGELVQRMQSPPSLNLDYGWSSTGMKGPALGTVNKLRKVSSSPGAERADKGKSRNSSARGTKFASPTVVAPQSSNQMKQLHTCISSSKDIGSSSVENNKVHDAAYTVQEAISSGTETKLPSEKIKSSTDNYLELSDGVISSATASGVTGAGITSSIAASSWFSATGMMEASCDGFSDAFLRDGARGGSKQIMSVATLDKSTNDRGSRKVNTELKHSDTDNVVSTEMRENATECAPCGDSLPFLSAVLAGQEQDSCGSETMRRISNLDIVLHGDRNSRHDSKESSANVKSPLDDYTSSTTPTSMYTMVMSQRSPWGAQSQRDGDSPKFKGGDTLVGKRASTDIVERADSKKIRIGTK